MIFDDWKNGIATLFDITSEEAGILLAVIFIIVVSVFLIAIAGDIDFSLAFPITGMIAFFIVIGWLPWWIAIFLAIVGLSAAALSMAGWSTRSTKGSL